MSVRRSYGVLPPRRGRQDPRRLVVLDVLERWTRVRPRRRTGATPAVDTPTRTAMLDAKTTAAMTHNPIRPISAPSPLIRCGTDHNRRIRETTDGRYLDLPNPAAYVGRDLVGRRTHRPLVRDGLRDPEAARAALAAGRDYTDDCYAEFEPREIPKIAADGLGDENWALQGGSSRAGVLEIRWTRDAR